MRTNWIKTLIAGFLLMAAAGTVSAESCGGDFCINWSTIDSGGIIESESGDGQWKLSGTIGQWDATEARALTGANWRLTGGFWGLTLEELADLLFRDRFEEES